MRLTMTCPCLFGLESVLSGELKRMEAQNIMVRDGRVTFTGGWDMLARANLGLRTAERVQLVVGTFAARSFEELFDQVAQIPFEEYLGRKDAFPVKGWSINSKLHSVPDCQSIIKRAVVRRLENAYGQSWFEESGPVHQIQFSILKDNVTVTLDSSGAGLHKRGYRKNANAAPIKETLAAGILDLARVYPDTEFYDPMCGSGTFVIEAALHALRIAPGLRRTFAAEKWGCVPENTFREERARAMDLIRRDATFKGYGFDIDPQAVELTRENAKKAGVSARVRVAQRDVKDFKLNTNKALVVCNPPYGERLLEQSEARALYRTMGEAFTYRDDLRYYIISPDEEFERYFGRAANKLRKLYNGMLKCNLYMYFK